MKQLTIISACLLAAVFAACNQPASKHAAAADSTITAVTDTTSAKPSEEMAAVAGKYPDPVCGMPYDTMFHEWSVYKKDTLHFCSPTCKRVFDKNPEKFAAKLGL